MGTFPITRARQELGFTPSTAVRSGITVPNLDTGAAIGQALVGGAELLIRKKKMDDTLIQDRAKQIRKSAELEIELFRAKNADTVLWEKQAKDVFNRANTAISGLNPSGGMREIINLETIGWRETKGAGFVIGEIKQKKQDTKGVMINDLVEAYRTADPIEIAKASETFDINAESIFSPDEARIVKRDATTAGFKAYFKDRASTDAEGTVATINKEIQAREKGKGRIPDEVMTDAELKDSLGVAQTIMKENVVAFENSLNGELIRIDNTPNLSQNDFDLQSKLLKTSILSANIPNTQKKKMLRELEKWRRGSNEIDYARILSLNQEMDAAQRSGIVDPTIGNRIVNASLEGAFGGRNKGGQRAYGDMVRRFEKLEFDERVQATRVIVRAFERENADDPRLIFLFHQAKNKLIADNPDATTRELFIRISALSEAYGMMPEVLIENKLRAREDRKILMISPDGKQYQVPIEKRQKFIDNGFTE